MTDSSERVAVRDVSHHYGPRRALDHMTWSAHAGAVTCVLGPNGAGKTSIMEMAEGLRRPDEGEVRVLGVDPWQATAGHRARVGVMLQDGGLPGGAKPLRFLRHVDQLYGHRGDLTHLIDALGIADFADTPLRRLSGGQRQRVALAAALTGRPDVAFLDEPSAGLDPHARLDVWDLIRSVKARDCAVVVTTHSFEEAERLADHVVVVAAGSVAAEGSVDEVAGRQGNHRLEDAYFSLTRPAARKNAL